ncbi:WD40-repeat-containing domain protein, partial [Ochromonadaceae sp. CCMP2298]
GFELAHHGSVNDAIFSPSEGRVATAGGDHLVKIWDPRDGSFVRSLAGHKSEVFSFLLSAGADTEILIWSMLTQTLNRRMLGHTDVIYG